MYSPPRYEYLNEEEKNYEMLMIIMFGACENDSSSIITDVIFSGAYLLGLDFHPFDFPVEKYTLHKVVTF